MNPAEVICDRVRLALEEAGFTDVDITEPFDADTGTEEFGVRYTVEGEEFAAFVKVTME